MTESSTLVGMDPPPPFSEEDGTPAELTPAEQDAIRELVRQARDTRREPVIWVRGAGGRPR